MTSDFSEITIKLSIFTDAQKVRRILFCSTSKILKNLKEEKTSFFNEFEISLSELCGKRLINLIFHLSSNNSSFSFLEMDQQYSYEDPNIEAQLAQCFANLTLEEKQCI